MILWATISFILSVVLLNYAQRTAVLVNFVDYPDSRKKHLKAVPPVGGIVIIPVFLILCYVSGFPLQEHFYFVAALILIGCVGVLDDKLYLPVNFRFIVHFIAAYLLVVGNGSTIYHLGNLFGFGDVSTQSMSVILSIICVVLLINAINMIDGLDGLCGGIVVIMLMALACAASISGGHETVLSLYILIGTVFGFLVYNYRSPFRKNASLFLGDSGSTALGLIICWFVIELTQPASSETQQGLLDPALIAWILAIPVFDCLALFFYRAWHGQSPFHSDRQHIHYLICDHTGDVESGVNFVHWLTLIYCASGVIIITLLDIPPAFIMPIWGGLFMLHASITFGAFRKILTKIV